MSDEIVILVVDDESTIRDSIAEILVQEQYRVYVAKNGIEALQVMGRIVPNLIISDIIMPEMNGYQFYMRVRQNADWVWIPFIFLTAKSDPDDVRFGREVGLDDYLTKPFSPEDLLSAIRGLLIRYEQLVAAANPPKPQVLVGRYMIGELVIDIPSRIVHVADKPLKLTPTEFEILLRLTLADGAAVRYDELFGEGEGQSYIEDDAAELLRAHVRNLRNKLKQAGLADEVIVNVHSFGYRLENRPIPV
jgi:DNA-binding response OmpR family regulator